MEKVNIREKVLLETMPSKKEFILKEDQGLEQAFLTTRSRNMSGSFKMLMRQHHLFKMLSNGSKSFNLKASFEKDGKIVQKENNQAINNKKESNKLSKERIECHYSDRDERSLRICLRKKPISSESELRTLQQQNIRECGYISKVFGTKERTMDIEKCQNGLNLESYNKYYQYLKQDKELKPQFYDQEYKITIPQTKSEINSFGDDPSHIEDFNTSKTINFFSKLDSAVDLYIETKLDKKPKNRHTQPFSFVDCVSAFKSRFSEPVFIMKTNTNFDKLFEFLKEIYLEDRFNHELLTKLNQVEIATILKMLGFDSQRIKKTIKRKTREAINKLLYDYLSGANTYENGKKLTNNKRFVFRKVRAIMIKKFLKGVDKEHVSKREKDNLFFKYYFVNQSEFSKLTHKQKKDIQSLFSVYYENKIHILWRFKQFTLDFSEILASFLPNIEELYFKEALMSVNIYLEFLKSKPPEFILTSNTHLKRLPYNRKVIESFVNGFYDKFGDFFDL